MRNLSGLFTILVLSSGISAEDKTPNQRLDAAEYFKTWFEAHSGHLIDMPPVEPSTLNGLLTLYRQSELRDDEDKLLETPNTKKARNDFAVAIKAWKERLPAAKDVLSAGKKEIERFNLNGTWKRIRKPKEANARLYLYEDNDLSGLKRKSAFLINVRTNEDGLVIIELKPLFAKEYDALVNPSNFDDDGE